ncbi:MAG: HAD-IIIA family hydrolase [Candidatus Bathyarchaeota archaeon]|nr:HAD-IIIA family hydrolase [Candidatus Bathyarchaeota archaeon]
MKKILVCLDRDGTLVYDNKYHLGRTDDWKSKIEILPTVIEGLRLLRTLSDVAIYIITNQPGIAIREFPLLTLDRAHEVNRYILTEIAKMGGQIDGYFLCPHANLQYVKKKTNYHFDEKMVCDCECEKPKSGMVFDALKSEGLTREEAILYVIGDRSSDVETALNINGRGILIPFENEPRHFEKIKKLDQANVYIARDFLDAAQFIVDQNKSKKFTHQNTNMRKV